MVEVPLLSAPEVRFTKGELAEFRTALEALPVKGNRPAGKAYENE